MPSLSPYSRPSDLRNDPKGTQNARFWTSFPPAALKVQAHIAAVHVCQGLVFRLRGVTGGQAGKRLREYRPDRHALAYMAAASKLLGLFEVNRDAAIAWLL